MHAQPPASLTNRPRGAPVLPILLALDTLLLGGFAALLAVNRLLDAQLGVYAPRNMDAASAILDFMDDLIPYLFVRGAALIVLALSTICVAVWRKARSPVLRYGTTALVLALIAAGAWSWVSSLGTTPTVPPMTPTPVAQVPPSPPKPLSGPTLSNQVPESAITSFATTPDGALWYAFDVFDDTGGVSPGDLQHGLYRLKDGRTSHWEVPGTIRVLEVAPDGSLYVGAGNGVLRYRAEKWESLADVVRDFNQFVPFTIAFDMAIAENGDLWVGGVHSLARFDGKAWSEYDVNVRRLLIAPDGSLWGEGWDGIAGSDCCFVHLTGDSWVTYTHSADLPVSHDLRSQIHDLMR